MEKLSTGCSNIDTLLRGGFSAHQINFVYGEASSGKTILTIQCAIQAARGNWKVFYLDSDQSFSPNRLESLPLTAESLERIIIFRPGDFKEQIGITETFENLFTKSQTLLVIDSITGLYRASLRESKDTFEYNRELNRQLAYLADLSRRFQLVTILTGEVHSQPGPFQWSIEPVATRSLGHWANTVARLRHTASADVRELVLEKLDGRSLQGPRTLFRITSDGIEDV
jgi:DNA repair protein RadB